MCIGVYYDIYQNYINVFINILLFTACILSQQIVLRLNKLYKYKINKKVIFYSRNKLNYMSILLCLRTHPSKI